jgi:hypothetical protein
MFNIQCEDLMMLRFSNTKSSMLYKQRVCQRGQLRHNGHHNDKHWVFYNGKYHHGVQTATIPDLVANAINHFSANQTVLMNQMAAMLYTNRPPLQPYNTNNPSNNSTVQCNNLLPWPQRVDSILEIE